MSVFDALSVFHLFVAKIEEFACECEFSCVARFKAGGGEGRGGVEELPAIVGRSRCTSKSGGY
jgi:hypothetical protein